MVHVALWIAKKRIHIKDVSHLRMLPMKHETGAVLLVSDHSIPLLLIACNRQVTIKSVTTYTPSELHGKMAATDQKKKK
jgi:hypothetical protein